MKKILQTICLSLLPAFSFAHTHAEYLGLVSELTHIKMCSEHTAASVLNDSDNSPELKRRVVEKYNELRTMSDELILQLEADCRSKKSICNYRKLDHMLTCQSMDKIKKDFYDQNHTYCSHKMEGYVWVIVQIEKMHNKLDKLNTEASGKDGMNSYSGFKGEEKYGEDYRYASVNDISSCRERKVERMVMMLDDMRLCPVQHLIKKVKKEKIEKVEHIIKMEGAFPGHGMNGQMITTAHHHHYKGSKKTCKCK